MTARFGGGGHTVFKRPREVIDSGLGTTSTA